MQKKIAVAAIGGILSSMGKQSENTGLVHFLRKDMKLLIALGAVFISSSAFAVSFDCAKASTFAEKTICSDPLLGKLDDALSRNYNAMLGADFGGSVKDLRNEQREWIANRNKCTTRECLASSGV